MKNVRIAAWLSLLFVSILFVSCAKKEKPEPAKPAAEVKGPYSDWKTYSYRNVRIVYPADHPRAEDLHAMALSYVASIRHDCEFLRIPVPSDTIVVLFHTGPGQGKQLSGQRYPHTSNDTLYFWLPGFYGVTLMQWLIPKWEKDTSAYRFLRHGLIALLDNSGQNYHVMTNTYRHNGKFISLDSLARDTTVNSDNERMQSAEAASFVDFLVYKYGTHGLTGMWQSKTSFDSTVTGLFNISVDSLQTEWLSLVSRQAKTDSL